MPEEDAFQVVNVAFTGTDSNLQDVLSNILENIRKVDTAIKGLSSPLPETAKSAEAVAEAVAGIGKAATGDVVAMDEMKDAFDGIKNASSSLTQVQAKFEQIQTFMEGFIGKLDVVIAKIAKPIDGPTLRPQRSRRGSTSADANTDKEQLAKAREAAADEAKEFTEGQKLEVQAAKVAAAELAEINKYRADDAIAENNRALRSMAESNAAALKEANREMEAQATARMEMAASIGNAFDEMDRKRILADREAAQAAIEARKVEVQAQKDSAKLAQDYANDEAETRIQAEKEAADYITTREKELALARKIDADAQIEADQMLAAARKAAISNLARDNAAKNVSGGRRGSGGFTDIAPASGWSMLFTGGMLLDPFVESIKGGAQFENMLHRLQATAGDTTPFNKLRLEILGIANQFEQFPEVVAAALYPIESAGYRGADGLKVLSAAAAMARGTQTSLTVVADVLTKTMYDYGLSANQAARVTDILTRAVTNSLVPGQQFSQALAGVISTGRNAGLSLEELVSALDLVTRQTKNAGTASTYLKNLINGLVNPTEQMRKAAKAAGLMWLYNKKGMEEIRRIGFGGVLQEIQDKTHGYAGALDALFPDMRKQQALTILLTGGVGRYTQLLQSNTKSQGAVHTANQIMNQDLQQAGQDIESLKKTADDNITHALYPALMSIATAVKGVLNWFNNLTPVMQGTLAVTVATTGAVMALSGVVLIVSSGIVTLKTGLLALTAAHTADTVAATENAAAEAAMGDAAVAAGAAEEGAAAAGIAALGPWGAAILATAALVGGIALAWTNAKEEQAKYYNAQNTDSTLSSAEDVLTKDQKQLNVDESLPKGANSAGVPSTTSGLSGLLFSTILAVKTAGQSTGIYNQHNVDRDKSKEGLDYEILAGLKSNDPNFAKQGIQRSLKQINDDTKEIKQLSTVPEIDNYPGQRKRTVGASIYDPNVADLPGVQAAKERVSALHADIKAHQQALATYQGYQSQVQENALATDDLGQKVADATIGLHEGSNACEVFARKAREAVPEVAKFFSALDGGTENGSAKLTYEHAKALGLAHDYVQGMQLPVGAQLFSETMGRGKGPGKSDAGHVITITGADTFTDEYGKHKIPAGGLPSGNRGYAGYIDPNDAVPGASNRGLTPNFTQGTMPDWYKKFIAGQNKNKNKPNTSLPTSYKPSVFSDDDNASKTYKDKIADVDLALVKQELAANHAGVAWDRLKSNVTAATEKFKIAQNAVRELTDALPGLKAQGAAANAVLLGDNAQLKKTKPGKGASIGQKESYGQLLEKAKSDHGIVTQLQAQYNETSSTLREATQDSLTQLTTLNNAQAEQARQLNETAKKIADAAKALNAAKREMDGASAQMSGKSDVGDRIAALNDKTAQYAAVPGISQSDVNRFHGQGMEQIGAQATGDLISEQEKYNALLVSTGQMSQSAYRDFLLTSLISVTDEMGTSAVAANTLKELALQLGNAISSIDWQSATDLISGWKEQVADGTMSTQQLLANLKGMQTAGLSPEDNKVLTNEIIQQTKQVNAEMDAAYKKTADNIASYFDKAFDVLSGKGNRSENLRKAGTDLLKEYEKKSLDDFVKKEVTAYEKKRDKNKPALKPDDTATAWVHSYGTYVDLMKLALQNYFAPQAQALTSALNNWSGGATAGSSKGTNPITSGITSNTGLLPTTASGFAKPTASGFLSSAATGILAAVKSTTGPAIASLADSFATIFKPATKASTAATPTTASAAEQPTTASGSTSAGNLAQAPNIADVLNPSNNFGATPKVEFSPPPGAGSSAASTGTTDAKLNAGTTGFNDISSLGGKQTSAGLSKANTAVSLAGTAAPFITAAGGALGAVGTAIGAAVPYVELALAAGQMLGLFGNGGPSKYAMGDVTQQQHSKNVFTDYSPTAQSGFSGVEGMRSLLGATTMQAAGVHASSGPPIVNINVHPGAYQGNMDLDSLSRHLVGKVQEGVSQMMIQQANQMQIDNARRGKT